MSRSQVDLTLESMVSNSDGFARVAGLHEHNLPRDGGMRIREISGRFLLIPYGDLFPPPETWDTEIPLNAEYLFRHVQDCRGVWQQLIVEHKETIADPKGGMLNSFPFQEEWDHKGKASKAICVLGSQLAVAGAQLFFHVFENGDEVLTRVANRLREATASRQLVLTITSDKFFVPWGMIYTHPRTNEKLATDGSNFDWEGFWGFRHIIEHNTEYVLLATGIRPDSAGLIPMSINIDESIDASLGGAYIASQLAFFKGLSVLDRRERRRKVELQTALSSEAFSDRIVYFCCHGIGAGNADAPNLSSAQLALTDQQPITAAEMAFWLQHRDFPSHPIVFINACQGGQMTTIFYQTLAVEFLKRKATCMIGAQIDIPAVFATEYARCLFGKFLNATTEGVVKLGPLIRDLAREFVKVHNNPLGLVYSIYRGADCFVDWRTVSNEVE